VAGSVNNANATANTTRAFRKSPMVDSSTSDRRGILPQARLISAELVAMHTGTPFAWRCQLADVCVGRDGLKQSTHLATYGPAIGSHRAARHASAKQLDQYVAVTVPRGTPTAQTLASQFLE
jgi:hypothetical protein